MKKTIIASAVMGVIMASTVNVARAETTNWGSVTTFLHVDQGSQEHEIYIVPGLSDYQGAINKLTQAAVQGGTQNLNELMPYLVHKDGTPVTDVSEVQKAVGEIISHPGSWSAKNEYFSPTVWTKPTKPSVPWSTLTASTPVVKPQPVVDQSQPVVDSPIIGQVANPPAAAEGQAPTQTDIDNKQNDAIHNHYVALSSITDKVIANGQAIASTASKGALTDAKVGQVGATALDALSASGEALDRVSDAEHRADSLAQKLKIEHKKTAGERVRSGEEVTGLAAQVEQMKADMDAIREGAFVMAQHQAEHAGDVAGVQGQVDSLQQQVDIGDAAFGEHINQPAQKVVEPTKVSTDTFEVANSNAGDAMDLISKLQSGTGSTGTTTGKVGAAPDAGVTVTDSFTHEIGVENKALSPSFGNALSKYSTYLLTHSATDSSPEREAFINVLKSLPESDRVSMAARAFLIAHNNSGQGTHPEIEKGVLSAINEAGEQVAKSESQVVEPASNQQDQQKDQQKGSQQAPAGSSQQGNTNGQVVDTKAPDAPPASSQAAPQFPTETGSPVIDNGLVHENGQVDSSQNNGRPLSDVLREHRGLINHNADEIEKVNQKVDAPRNVDNDLVTYNEPQPDGSVKSSPVKVSDALNTLRDKHNELVTVTDNNFKVTSEAITAVDKKADDAVTVSHAASEKSDNNAKHIEENNTFINENRAVINRHTEQLGQVTYDIQGVKEQQQATNQVVAEHSATLRDHEQRIDQLEHQNNGKFANIDKSINANRKRAAGGISGVAAMASIPSLEAGQQFSVGAGVGGFDGANAVAVGVHYRVSEHVAVGANVGADTASQSAVYGVGVSMGW